MKLHPFQEEGVNFLLQRKRAYLGDEMGLGKTVQVLAAAHRAGIKKVVVVCPASVRPIWVEEGAVWAPGAVVETHSYAALSRRRMPPEGDLLVFDEAHYLKNPKASRTKAGAQLARKFDRVWLLSGTPMPNDPRELYVPAGILGILPPQASSYWRWTHRYTYGFDNGFGYQVGGVKNAEELARLFRGHMLRRRTSDVALNLPPLRMHLVPIELTEKQRRELDERVVEALPPDILEAVRAGIIDTGSDAGTATARRVLGTFKAPFAAARIIEELEEGAYDSIVVMAHHRDTIATLEETFNHAGFETVTVHGGTTASARTSARQRFQAGEVPIFIGQNISAGTGITLTRAQEIVLLEPDWTPGNNIQAIKRIHRISQEHPCRARIFTMPRTLDHNIMSGIRRKMLMQQEVGL